MLLSQNPISLVVEVTLITRTWQVSTAVEQDCIKTAPTQPIDHKPNQSISISNESSSRQWNAFQLKRFFRGARYH